MSAELICIFTSPQGGPHRALTEIGLLQAKITRVDNETEFGEFVNEAEQAFSREHTQRWLGRRINSKEIAAVGRAMLGPGAETGGYPNTGSRLARIG